ISDLCCFFFQAEDGIRDFHVTGVQTCALPISFPEARKPAIKLWVDFGEEVGIKRSSAQLTRRYTPEGLVGTPVLGVVNFPPRRIAGFESEVLILGVINPDDPGDVALVRPDVADVQGRPPG